MRVLFAGTPEVAVPTLEALLASDHEVVGVLTRPDARSGRGRQTRASPVREVAEAAGLPVDPAAELLEWSRPKLWRIETGGTAMRSLDVEAMCRVYEAPPSPAP